MRYPRRVLGADETPPRIMLRYVAEQIGAVPEAFALYARREETRRDHTMRLKAESSVLVNIVPLKRSAIVSTASLRALSTSTCSQPTESGLETPSWSLDSIEAWINGSCRQEQNISQPPEPG
nr:DUF4158 domain-containing protein [Neorhizobium sp. T6_25]